MAPLIKALREYQDLEVITVSTQQHESLLSDTLDSLNISTDLELSVPDRSTVQTLVASIGIELEQPISQCDFIVVQGDTISSIALIGLAHGNQASFRWRALTLAQVPIVASVITWFFFSPPTFRFGWGPVFSFFFVFIAFALKALFTQPRNSQLTRLIQRGFIPALALGLVIIVGFNAVVRFQADSITQNKTWSLGPLQIRYKVAPVINVPIKEIPLQSGLVVTSPIESDQCWDNYPLCSPMVTSSLSLRTSQIQQGFLP